MQPNEAAIHRIELPEPMVIRNFSIPADLFTYFRDFRREQEALMCRAVTNSQALALMIAQHKQLMASPGAVGQ